MSVEINNNNEATVRWSKSDPIRAIGTTFDLFFRPEKPHTKNLAKPWKFFLKWKNAPPFNQKKNKLISANNADHTISKYKSYIIYHIMIIKSTNNNECRHYIDGMGTFQHWYFEKLSENHLNFTQNE